MFHAGRINARHWYVCAQPGHHEGAECEKDSLAQLGRFAKAAEIEVSGQLFGC
jgi:hypothetical protein